MHTAESFLFLVNPRLAYNPYPDWARWRVDLDQGRDVHTEWNTGNRRRGMDPGDEAFIVKTGVEPRGLVGYGYLTSGIVIGPHWNPDAKLPETGYVLLQINELFDLDNPVPLADLSAMAPDVLWTPRQSGTRIPPQAAEDIRHSLGLGRFVPNGVDGAK